MLLILPLAAILLMACSGSTGEEITSTPQKVDEEQTSTTETEVKAETFVIGDTIELGDYVIKVTKFENPYIESNEFSQPETGNKFVAIEVEYQNNTYDKTISYNLFDWTVSDQEGYAYDSTFLATKTPDLSSGDLNPGGKVKGWVTFEVLESSTKFKAKFTPSFWDNDNVEIELN